jgi:hypothetical protein
MGTEEGVAGVQELQQLQNARLVSLPVTLSDPGVTPHVPTPLRPCLPTSLHYSVVLRLAGLEKDEFGSVILSFGVLAPLWQEASAITSPAKRTRPAHFNRFRIRDDSRTNFRCKSTKTRSTKSDSVALFNFRRIFHPVWIRT